jgi:ADP-ribose pyrophosphatase YjhB (NUDIX family)
MRHRASAHEQRDQPMTFCPQCASALVERAAYGRVRPVCPRCGYVAFHDPKVAVGAVIEHEGKILLTLRAHDPGRGQWGLPAGYMEWDEDVLSAGVREVYEETGLVVRMGVLVGVYSAPARGVVLIIYTAQIVSGQLRVSAESEAVEFFAPEALPQLAFSNTVDVIADWQAGRAPEER